MDIKMYFCNMSFDVLKSLHIIFVVCWFAGLFYMVRLFIYHREAQLGEKAKRDILCEQFEVMEKKLWWIITTPSMVLTTIFGTWMIVLNYEYYLSQPWMHLKLGFVFLLIIYHFFTQKLLEFHLMKLLGQALLELKAKLEALLLASIQIE